MHFDGLFSEGESDRRGIARDLVPLLRCSCGFLMKRLYEKPAIDKIKLSREKQTPEGIRGPKP